MSEEWVTYSRMLRNSSEPVTTTKLFTEKRPVGFGDGRTATEDEITAEKQKRAERIADQERVKQFEARTDYAAAVSIRNALEWMTPENNPLDAFTVEEWQAIEKRLTRCKT
jgi:hypothetical protein